MGFEHQNLISVYLDLNKWVDLARAEAGLSEGEPFRSALQAALRSVADGRAIFPLSSAHLMEVAKIGDDARRAKLASLMVRLSQGWFLTATSSLLIPELRKSLAKEFDIPLIGPGSSTIFTRSIKSALIDPAHPSPGAEIDDSLLRLPGILEAYLATSRVPSHLIRNWRTFAQQHEAGRSLRWETSKTVRKRAYCVLVMDGLGTRFAQVLREFGLSLDDRERIGPDRCVRLLENIPFLDVEIGLHTERNEHRDRRIEPNDELDISFLSSAVPYCQVVVTEKFWTSLVKRLKLDTKYGSNVYSDLRDIVPHLQAA